LPLSNAEVKNEWCYILTPPLSLHGMDGETLYLFTLYIIVTCNLIF
jgi:hypothetical protein